MAASAAFESSSQNILWAADIWHSVKTYWCREAQVPIRAKRAMLVTTVSIAQRRTAAPALRHPRPDHGI
jgi:hypothetical protein